MRRRAILLLTFALAAGGLSAILALRMLRNPQSAAAAATDGLPVSVAVAVRDMNVGTLLSEQDVRLVAWPSGDVPAGYATSAAEVVGRGLLTPVRMNEPLLASKLADAGSGGGMQIMIPDGKRAMSVRVDDVVGVAGFVLPGTRVDVVVTMDEASQQSEPATRVLLQNIEVVSAGQSIERNPEGEPQQVAVVTLLVEPEQAEQLALAHSNGRLQLALRNPLDMDSVGTRGVYASYLIPGRPEPRVVVRTPSAAPAPAPRPPARLEMEVYRGPERTTVETPLGGGR